MVYSLVYAQPTETLLDGDILVIILGFSSGTLQPPEPNDPNTLPYMD